MACLSCMRSDYQCPMQRDVGFVIECVRGGFVLRGDWCRGCGTWILCLKRCCPITEAMVNFMEMG
jgi:Fe-S oxidoreductase